MNNINKITFKETRFIFRGENKKVLLDIDPAQSVKLKQEQKSHADALEILVSSSVDNLKVG